MTGTSQYEFTKEKSCLVNLIAFCNETMSSVDVVHLDINKAFNIVSLDILIDKLTESEWVSGEWKTD